MNVLEQNIWSIVEPVADGFGYSLVNITVNGAKGGYLVEVLAEPNEPSNKGNIDDYAKMSREMSALLDVEDPIVDRYTLEVGSPGIDRPLVKLEDYSRFAGFDAKITLDRSVVGRRNFKGTIVSAENDTVILLVDAEQHEVPFSQIAQAKLVLTDELIDASREGAI